MNYLQLVFAVGILFGIRLMSSPKTAVAGNVLGALAMLGAIAATLVGEGIVSNVLLWIGLVIGSGIGILFAQKVLMIQMPQMVAVLNGLGGGASALVALIVVLQRGSLSTFVWLATGAALIVGAITFSGSMVAAAKLHGVLGQKPVHLRNHVGYLWVNLLVILVELGRLALGYSVPALSAVVLLAFSLVFGILFTMGVGGADMPITISLLNSLSGLAGAIAGFSLGNPLLVAVGAIVGASGLILTEIMCRAMNRSLIHILLGRTTSQGTQPKPVGLEEAVSQQGQGHDWTQYLLEAQRVVIVPGYGMALAQAQHSVKRLVDVLEEQGKEVKIGIHPVAGRMPGHMNVLLAEVDVPYELLLELDQVNQYLEQTDLVIVVGANDVVNPAAMEAEGTPIYGMPIIRADLGNHVIVCNYDTAPGYAGVPNQLYQLDHVSLLLGDAKDSLSQLLNVLQPQSKPDTLDDLGPAKLLAAAKRVAVVPGYGMALAQAQQQVKFLIEELQRKGISVQIAVHPVAGRMPGHMNVLMAEVDIPYDLLYEIDEINEEFKAIDVAVVVGANDVVNPAANTAEGTPIYGMPVLNVNEARHVIVLNLDRSPGYAGVDNPLYDAPNCLFIPGDAAQTVSELVQSLELIS